MYRRALLSYLPFVVVVGCASSQPSPMPDQSLVQNVRFVLNGLQQIMPMLNGNTAVNQWYAAAQQAGTSLQASPSNQSSALQFITAVQAILGAASAMGVIPPPYSLIVGAVAALLPLIASAFGLKLAALERVANWPSLTPEQAMAVLGK